MLWAAFPFVHPVLAFTNCTWARQRTVEQIKTGERHENANEHRHKAPIAYGVVPKMASGSFTWRLPRVNDKRTILKQPPEIRALFPIRLSLLIRSPCNIL
jgi:hypothetical protein